MDKKKNKKFPRFAFLKISCNRTLHTFACWLTLNTTQISKQKSAILPALKRQYAILLCIVLFGCASNKNFHQIKFGEGGGVTGNRTEYTVNSKGELFKKISLKSETQKTGKIPNDKLKEIINKSEILCKTDTVFKPDNLYYFIEVEMKSCRKNFVWSDRTSNENKNLKEFYEYLNNNIIKQ